MPQASPETPHPKLCIVNTPVVAVLVAAYNAAHTLPRCLDSLCRQTLREVEIICIDDCSTDATMDCLRQRAAADSRIRIMQTQHNSGQAVARNLGLSTVTAQYVCMVDADDWLSEDCLQRAAETFAVHPQTDTVVFHLVRHFDTTGSEEDFGLPETLARGGALSGMEAFDACIDGWRLHGCNVVRTELHRRIPFDTTTRLFSDDNASRLHYLHSREVRACDGIYFWRQHAASTTNAFSYLRFDFVEANLSLRRSLEEYEKNHEPLPPHIMPRFERDRWYVFLGCYRMAIVHRRELTAAQRKELRRRFADVLATFSRETLPREGRRRPGYWLIHDRCLFHAQQCLFVLARRLSGLPLE